MTVELNDVVSGPFVGDGVTTRFPRDFSIGSADHVFVSVNGATSFTGFTVLNPELVNADVEFDTAPVAGAEIYLTRQTPRRQDTDYSPQGEVSPVQVEEDLDYAQRQIQELWRDVDRSLKSPLGSSGRTYENIIGDSWVKTDAQGNLVRGGDASEIAAAESHADAAKAARDAALAAQALAEAAAIIAANANAIIFSEVSDLLDNVDLSYDVEAAIVAVAGARIEAGSHVFLVAASGATDHDETTINGVKLYNLSKLSAVTAAFIANMPDGYLHMANGVLFKSDSTATGVLSVTNGNFGIAGVVPGEAVSIKHFGIADDPVTDQSAQIEIAHTWMKHQNQSAGTSTAVAGQDIRWPFGRYNFGGNHVRVSNYCNPVPEGGNVTIIDGGFHWDNTYGNVISRFRFVNPPVKSATISGITQADPCVVTAVGHPFVNGEVVRFREIVGMHELNFRQFVIANATANTFELTNADATGWTAYVSGGKCFSGAAIEFDTNNVSRSNFVVEHCVCYGTHSTGQCFISTREFGISRSTSLVVRNCVTAGIDRVVHSTCDELIMEGGFYWQSTELEPPFYSKGKAKLNGGVYIPIRVFADAFWWAFDTLPNASSNGFTAYGARFSGENGGGFPVLKVLQSSDNLASNLNSDNIFFSGCILNCRLGGPGNAGGVVILGKGSGAGLACPNGIQFHGCDINVNPATGQVLVRGEDSGSPELTDGYNFKIDIDEITMRIFDRVSKHPVSDILLPFLSDSTRNWMMNRHQVVSSAAAYSAIDILLGNKVQLVNGGADTPVTGVLNAKAGDEIYFIAKSGTAVIWTIPHEDGGAATAFHCDGNAALDPTAPVVYHFLFDADDHAIQAGRAIT